MAPYSSSRKESTDSVSDDKCNGIDNGVKHMSDKVNGKESQTSNDEKLPPVQIIWPWVGTFGSLHLGGLYGLYLMFTSAMWQTNVFTLVMDVLCATAVTGGAHRLWSHKAFKAKLPLRIFLAYFYTASYQFSIYHWVRDHRVHHKYSETNADPHNAKRGFFFSHIGWLLSKRQQDCLKRLKEVDMSDVWADPVVKYNYLYYTPQVLLACFVIPTIIPMWLWKETFCNAFFVSSILRFILTLHRIFLINSAAHLWGSKPYDVNINPAENSFVSIFGVGEGFHNYHHTFPCDYSASEFGTKLNFTTAFLNLMAWLGQAYDLKTVPKSVIEARKLRTGEDSLSKLKEKETIAKAN